MGLVPWLRLLALISVDEVQFPTEAAVFFRVFLSKGFSLRFMCSDQHVKFRMPLGFSLTSSLLNNTYTHLFTCSGTNESVLYHLCVAILPNELSSRLIKTFHGGEERQWMVCLVGSSSHFGLNDGVSDGYVWNHISNGIHMV